MTENTVDFGILFKYIIFEDKDEDMAEIIPL